MSNTKAELKALQRTLGDECGANVSFIDSVIAGLVARPVPDPLCIDGYVLPVTPPSSLWYIAGDHTWSRSKTGGHTGLDINLLTGGDTDLGQPVYSTCNGLVVYAQKAPGAYWGNIVVVISVTPTGQLEFWRYAHLDTIDAQVSGGYIFADDSVGTIGKGGQNRYSAHLHLDCWRGSMQSAAQYRNYNGGWIDPLEAWKEAGVEFNWGVR